MKKVHSVIKFDQRAWLKPFFEMNIKLRQKPKNNFEKEFFKLMNNAVFGKTMQNVRKHRNGKPVTTSRSRISLVSRPNYHTTKFFTKKLLAIEMRKSPIFMNKYFFRFINIIIE